MWDLGFPIGDFGLGEMPVGRSPSPHRQSAIRNPKSQPSSAERDRAGDVGRDLGARLAKLSASRAMMVTLTVGAALAAPP
jgi:hypothetical protein